MQNPSESLRTGISLPKFPATRQ